jgi:hypothetical protein
VQQHLGQFVAIREKKIVAVGQDEEALRKQAAALAQCPEEELLLHYVYPPDFEIPPDLEIPY